MIPAAMGATELEPDYFRRAYVIPGTALFMAAISLMAAVGPASCGLRIQPTAALRSD